MVFSYGRSEAQVYRIGVRCYSDSGDIATTAVQRTLLRTVFFFPMVVYCRSGRNCLAIVIPTSPATRFLRCHTYWCGPERYWNWFDCFLVASSADENQWFFCFSRDRSASCMAFFFFLGGGGGKHRNCRPARNSCRCYLRCRNPSLVTSSSARSKRLDVEFLCCI